MYYSKPFKPADRKFYQCLRQKMESPARVKHLLYKVRVYVLGFGGLSIVAALVWPSLDGHQVTLAIAFSLIAGLYSFEKQHLADTAMFEKLSNHFTERYQSIRQRLAEDKLTDEARKELGLEYYDLCSEEFLYFAKGYIYPEVFYCWALGMIEMAKKFSLSEVWKGESSDLYYGFDFKELERWSREGSCD